MRTFNKIPVMIFCDVDNKHKTLIVPLSEAKVGGCRILELWMGGRVGSFPNITFYETIKHLSQGGLTWFQFYLDVSVEK